ncbi:wall-associated receptor kinase-like 14 isoform X2 [Physcomitrium patens]|uniref:Protein kinase domain-containing protein n=1 Tax=Physcomitrium patens TaxID=3218 RepID=A0A7I4F3V0_PHYPA|nr:wall-associated receptor kinase-like 14 isoform X2 [Physcomitrium patens]|eukprot:XP_024393559.1 wall-associated receptor kinase-like 14 isoform X2 [Physcomitrella patens]
MATFAVKSACALVIMHIMIRVCHAASPNNTCKPKCGETEVRYPFSLQNYALGQCVTEYPDLGFQCLYRKLYLNLSASPTFTYEVQNIDYKNQILSIVPYGNNAICSDFTSNIFGTLTITNTTTLLLDCGVRIQEDCTSLDTIVNYDDICNRNGTGVSSQGGANRWACPMRYLNFADSRYNQCHLFERAPTELLSGQNKTVTVELQFEVKNISTLDTSPSPQPAASPEATPSADMMRRNLYIILGIVAGFTAAVLIFLIALLYCCRLSRRGPSDLMKYDGGDKKEFAKIRSSGSGHLTTLFTYKELDHATQSFSTKHELGGGGFGTVYKGKLSDGRLVAVKKLNQGGNQGIQQFHNEVDVLSKVRHPHLVQLLGCCMERPLLVYEYVPNGSISNHLHAGCKAPLPWKTRLEIAVQTAEALAYLHFLVDPPIFHRDVKTTNILLDQDFKAKIADFGLSRLVVNTENTHISTAPQGTPGYLDPDYHESYVLSDKSDVYSFGVVLMELVTAKKAVDMTRERKEINLASLAVAKIQSGCLHEILDPDLTVLFYDYPMAQVMVEQVAELAFRCLASEKDDRPSMKEVLTDLLRIQAIGFRRSSGMEPSLDNKDSAKPLLNKNGGCPASPTSVQDVWRIHDDSM